MPKIEDVEAGFTLYADGIAQLEAAIEDARDWSERDGDYVSLTFEVMKNGDVFVWAGGISRKL